MLPQAAPEIAGGRVIVAHLGSGASMCAMRDRRSVDSTLSFTALDRLCMGTRPGAVDPGVILYLQRVSARTPPRSVGESARPRPGSVLSLTEGPIIAARFEFR